MRLPQVHPINFNKLQLETLMEQELGTPLTLLTTYLNFETSELNEAALTYSGQLNVSDPKIPAKMKDVVGEVADVVNSALILGLKALEEKHFNVLSEEDIQNFFNELNNQLYVKNEKWIKNKSEGAY